MPRITLNGRLLDVPDGTRIIEAADRAGIPIPRFCYHPGLSVAANCRMCLVESSKHPKLIPACHERCQDGQTIDTRSPRVIEARRSVLEFILLNHPVDCPICDQAGECELQDLYFAHDHLPSRHAFRKRHKVKARLLGPEVVYDAERCINCTRCIRVCDEVARQPQLCQVQRGERAFIDVFPGTLLDHPYSLCTVDVCPVGALTSRDFRFRCRVWFLRGTPSVCMECSRGCNVRVDTFNNAVQRVVPRENLQINGHWACDEGRLAFHRFETHRLTAPQARGVDVPYATAVQEVAIALAGAAQATALLLSPALTNEDAFAILNFLRLRASRLIVAIGGRPDGIGDAILRRADRNGNRAGVSAALAAASIAPVPVETLLAAVQSGEIPTLMVAGEDTPDPVGLDAALQVCRMSVAFACIAPTWAKRVTHLFPLTSPFETAGTVCNEDGVVQSLTAALTPPTEARTLRATQSDIEAAILAGEVP